MDIVQMHVVRYLKQHGLEKLKEEFFIKVKEYDEGLITLNYNQIASPKAHPIVMECTEMVLSMMTTLWHLSIV